MTTRPKGFTLVELLIALGILGTIATFTIPKIIGAQQDERYNAIAKEGAATIATAYQVHVHKNGYSPTTSLHAVVPYLNYMKRTTALIDSYPGQGSIDCSAWSCYQLANGAVLAFDPGQTFAATDDLAITYFYLDPNGTYSGSPNAKDKSIVFFVYYNGRVTSQETALENSHDGFGVTYYTASQVDKDPDWFRW